MAVIMSFPIFILSTLAFLTFPGLLIINKIGLRLGHIEKLTLSTISGFIIYTILSYFFHLLNLYLLLVPIIILVDLYYLKNYKLSDFKIPTKMYSPAVLVFTLGVTFQLLVIFPSGSINKNGDIIFYSAHAHDSMWHIAVANEISNKFPLSNPVISDFKLVNYHFFSDITLSDFHTLTKIPEINLYFKFFPVLWSILLAGISYYLGKRLKNKAVGTLSMFFALFGGSFGYIATWIKNKTISGESIFWATQPHSSIGNPPQIISDILFLLIIFLVSCTYKNKKSKAYFLFIPAISILPEIKVYAAVVVFLALGLVLVVDFTKKDRNTKLAIAFVASVIFSIIFYLPNTISSQSFLIFQPWWFIRTMIVENSRLGLIDWELRRQTYLSEGNIKRVLQIELTSLAIFIIGNLGTRIIGIFEVIKRIKKLFSDQVLQFLVFSSIVSLAFPLLFLQKGVAGNTAQTLQYFILSFGVLSALIFERLLSVLKHKLIKITIITFMVATTIPTQTGLIYDFYKGPPVTRISKDEQNALEFIKDNSNSSAVILTPPYDKYSKYKDVVTPPIWAWFDTTYVAALAQRKTYISDLEQLEIMAYSTKDRIDFQKTFFDTGFGNNTRNILAGEEISLIYFPKVLSPKYELSDLGLTKIFDNDASEIWRVN